MTHQHYILDENRKVIEADLMTWARWFQDSKEKRRVALFEQGGIRVSTVFLGLDHNYDDGPPILWESMIFGGPNSEDQDRCSGTWDDALEMHKQMIERAMSPATRLTP